MDFFLPDTHLMRIKHLNEGQTELTMVLEIGRLEVGDLLIGSTDTWKVTKVLPSIGEVRVQVRKA
ncbi:hypothetical protein [Deinococcus hopiensis]|uniref:Uncharacterized protein n=1 Tax=Deinococcus hopiensis KR-140 TaxID=695939 RepID=A0A1W1VCV2_9DEIO|nr:hypothetical protein [Deinococcus hopiensis]SMB91146.1 hypothetical protein SAMN00790413_01009 [Deinococcus hopiensis KR-140]